MFKAKLVSNGVPEGFELEIQFNIGTGEKIDKRSFLTKGQALDYLDSCKRTYLWDLFSRYVNNSRILTEESSNSLFYKDERRLSVVNFCLQMNQDFTSEALISMCSIILKYQDRLREILPIHLDQSFQSSVADLNELIQLSKSYLQNHD